ncbi:hypothetical protein MRX96_052012 [Rhipicephalus microplus]
MLFVLLSFVAAFAFEDERPHDTAWANGTPLIRLDMSGDVLSGFSGILRIWDELRIAVYVDIMPALRGPAERADRRALNLLLLLNSPLPSYFILFLVPPPHELRCLPSGNPQLPLPGPPVTPQPLSIVD